MLDWNWFYSSVAQSAAVIVGIFAAFIITKIINNQIEFSLKRRKLQELINESQKLAELANIRDFDWFNETIRKNQFVNLRRLYEEGSSKEPVDYYNKLEFQFLIQRHKS